MGSRLHGNDGRRRRTHTVIPATRRRLHNRHSRESGNPGVGFPTRTSTHLHDICVPQRELRKGLRTRESTARVGMGSRLHGNDGRRRRTHTVIPATRRRLHNRHSRESGNLQLGHLRISTTFVSHNGSYAKVSGRGNQRRGVGMGSRLHGNDARRRRTHTVIPATRRRLHNRHSRESGNPGVGFPAKKSTHLHDICLPQRELRKGLRTRESTARGGDGFPSPRERRAEAAHPHRHSREGSYAKVSRQERVRVTR